MKAIKVKAILMLNLLLTGWVASGAKAQSSELQQLLLNIEKLTQFKAILSDMKKGISYLSTGIWNHFRTFKRKLQPARDIPYRHVGC
ncbi:MAG: hypothetical protein JKY70_06900 [Mucilaginibacter sp.]|nr:hypothetical protein [Mucilaginibacter sp.]